MFFLEEDDDDEKKRDEGRMDGFTNRLLKNRLVMVNGTVDQEMAEKVIAQLLVLDSESKEPIRVVITSPGGHVDSGYAIHDVLRFVSSPVITLGAGWVASIAVPIFLGGNKGKRYSLPNTRFLLHQPSGGAGGVAADIRIEAQEILKIRTRINAMIAQETGQPVEKVAKDSDRNFWMSAEEAQDYGIVSRIIEKYDQAV
ncbi:MAG: ATP-dependent Clp protease proteolytic subunit [Candidatus Hydrogenedentes bacterium]|nr:ATP-dependent Clp protease proteolytic subunit [Candidatus Hydrogenedentota bacterium]MBI3118434.1 ATP-dependent Clp protease proteolytic subunit [Candidatus Hydrogenedentota bacterium]